MNRFSSSPIVYLYLDSAGVDSLFSQTTDRLETGFKGRTENAKKGKAGGVFGLGKALSMLFEGKLSAETELSRRNAGEVTSTLTPEQKLKNLQLYLAKFENSTFFTDLSSARLAAESKSSVFISSPGIIFELPQFLPKGRGVSQVNEDGAILFSVHDGPAFIQMAASLKKMPRVQGKMGHTSHEAILLRQSRGRHPLGVFASLWKLRENSFQMKPFAIWI